MAQPLVVVITVNWQEADTTIECIQSLQRIEYDNYLTLVVDNGSADNSVSRLSEKLPNVPLLVNATNEGFAAACNRGIDYAIARGASYVWLLNNDAYADCGALSELVDVAQRDRSVGIVGSVVYDWETGRRVLAWGGGMISKWTGRSVHVQKPRRVDYITGASMLIRREVLNQIGVLDDAYFMYWEDADYCYRARRAGFKLAVATESKVWHREAATAKRQPLLLDSRYTRSGAIFFRRYSRMPYVPIMVGMTGRIVKRLLRGDVRRAWAVWCGVWK